MTDGRRPAPRPGERSPAERGPAERGSTERGPAERGPPKPAGASLAARPVPPTLGPRAVAEGVGRLLVSEGWDDYALLDTGLGAKLERYGGLTVVRPEPQAMGPRRLPPEVWSSAGAVFAGNADEEGPGRWRTAPGIGETWTMSVLGVPIVCRLTAFRHVGIFPEQVEHWRWMHGRVTGRAAPARILNLFGYTGVASLVAASAGAEVTHVDASKKAVAWGRENQALAGLEAAPIRWIVEDAVRFCEREVRRGRRYDGILVDPPRFGRGAEGEVWNLEDDLPHLLGLLRDLLAPGPSFLALTTYAMRMSHLAGHELVADLFGHRGGTLTSGELALRETGLPGTAGRLLSTSLYSRFEGEP